MKRICKIVAFLCVLVGLFAFAACEPVSKSYKEVSVKVVYAESEQSFEVSGEFATVKDVMDALVEQGEGFTYEGADSEYGLFVSTVCGYTVSGNEFWGVYTDSKYEDSKGLSNVYEEYTVELGGTVYYFCASGVSSQCVANGEVILLIVSEF